MPKLQETKLGGFFITLPKDLIRAKRWKRGDFIIATNGGKDGNIILVKIRSKR